MNQCFRSLLNDALVLPGTAEPCTGAPRGYRTLHEHSRLLQILAPALPDASEPFTGPPRGFRSLLEASGGFWSAHPCSRRLQNLALTPNDSELLGASGDTMDKIKSYHHWITGVDCYLRYCKDEYHNDDDRISLIRNIL
ncbi:hypothetical protein BDD12DRAFT_890511 [Trichophaea hybrida]|nr:hypothetical protein BDD12DRAFT_890511 [Trichophaea hybrida]